MVMSGSEDWSAGGHRFLPLLEFSHGGLFLGSIDSGTQEKHLPTFRFGGFFWSWLDLLSLPTIVERSCALVTCYIGTGPCGRLDFLSDAIQQQKKTTGRQSLLFVLFFFRLNRHRWAQHSLKGSKSPWVPIANQSLGSTSNLRGSVDGWNWSTSHRLRHAIGLSRTIVKHGLASLPLPD